MRIALATDAWRPQINGVVTTLQATAAELRRRGHEVRIIHPRGCFSVPCPSYPQIRLVLRPYAYVARELRCFRPQAIHIATEGPLGLAVRRYCRARRLPFTSAYHTRYPEYLAARWPIPPRATYAGLRWFHGAATRTFVSSASLEAQLKARGFRHLHRWCRGVDLGRFRPVPAHPLLAGLPRPLMACVGRVAVEKNIPAFLRLDLPGTKLVVGDGPQLPELRARYPQAVYAGFRSADELAQLLSGSDVMVFPSRTDTFGLAMIEAQACGLPVAAFPVPGPLDVIDPGVTGAMHEDLALAIHRALPLERTACIAGASAFTWEAATSQFLAGLAPIGAAARATLPAGHGSAIIGRIGATPGAVPDRRR
ncbi:MAG: glycosyltransferase family 1 protein [Proteobacteria bacterium]|nr:glycosyltransferase family 1 protein [Pseudomonadota bacterium]